MENIPNDGEIMRNRRRVLDVTLAVLAERIQVAIPTLSQWERGKRTPSRAMRYAWESALTRMEKRRRT